MRFCNFNAISLIYINIIGKGEAFHGLLLPYNTVSNQIIFFSSTSRYLHPTVPGVFCGEHGDDFHWAQRHQPVFRLHLGGRKLPNRSTHCRINAHLLQVVLSFSIAFDNNE